MTTKQPRLCGGIVVSGTCTISVLVGATPYTITIPEGTYWFDPVLTGIVTLASAGNLDALGVFTAALDAADAGGTYSQTYVSGDSTEMRGWAGTITRSAATFSIRGSNAATTTEGKRFLRFLGYDALRDETAAIALTSRLSPAIWDPLRGEDGSPEDVPDSNGVTVRTGGYAYSYDNGDPLLNRVVSIPAMRAPSVKKRTDSVDAYLDINLSLESALWPWLNRGSPVRYWADKNATQNTYLDAAMTATATSFTLPTNSLLAGKTMVCVDGEWMVVKDGIGTTTVGVYRGENPVAHSKYAPVSSDTVATYVLGESDGNINQSGFDPSRRAEYDDRWDVAISLARTAGV